MSEVENFMCNCSVFAKGKDLLVYMDDADTTHATSLFLFREDRCDGMLLKVNFQSRHIIDELMTQMSLLYQEEQLLSTTYGTRYPSFMWFGEKTHVHMTQEDQMVEFRKTYEH